MVHVFGQGSLGLRVHSPVPHEKAHANDQQIAGITEAYSCMIAHDRRRSPNRWKVFPHNCWQSLAVFSAIRRSWVIIWKLAFSKRLRHFIFVLESPPPTHPESAKKHALFVWTFWEQKCRYFSLWLTFLLLTGNCQDRSRLKQCSLQSSHFISF